MYFKVLFLRRQCRGGGGGGGVAERFKPLASKQEWSCRVWVRIPLMPRPHMPLIPTPPRVSTGMAHFSIMWQGSLDIALMQLKGT